LLRGSLENFSSPSQQQERLKALQITLYNALRELDPFSNDALVCAGEKFAEKYRPESIEPTYDCHPFEEVDELFTYGTFERLQDLERQIQEVLSWILLALERKPPIVRQNSFHVRVIGEILPRIYEKIFDEKYTASINGPGPQFIQAVRAKMPNHLPEYSPETIVKYRQRMKDDAKTRKGAFDTIEKSRVKKSKQKSAGK
jgi:hypothetical protein